MGGQRFDVGSVSGEDGPVWLCHRDDQCINRGTCPSEPAQLRGSAGNGRSDRRINNARLEKPMRVDITAWVPSKTFDEHHRGHDGGP